MRREEKTITVENVEGGLVRVLTVGPSQYQALPSWSYTLAVWYGPSPDGRKHRRPRRGDVLDTFRDGGTLYAVAPSI